MSNIVHDLENFMPRKRKNLGLLFLTGGLISVILLAVSLSNLQLQNGTPPPGVVNSENTYEFSISSPNTMGTANPLVRGVFAFFLLIFMFYIAGRLLAFVRVKQILWLLLVVGIFFLLVWYLPGITHRQGDLFPNEYIELPTATSEEVLTTPLGKPPQELVWVLTIVFVLGIALLGMQFLKQGMNSAEEEDVLLQEAEAAINNLKAGLELKNVILRCYLHMAHALQEEHGIERSDYMTTQEFERWLAVKGVPPVPVHQLTSLFEKARYGMLEPGGNDEKAAFDSLNEIIEFCRSGEG